MSKCCRSLTTCFESEILTYVNAKCSHKEDVLGGTKKGDADDFLDVNYGSRNSV